MLGVSSGALEMRADVAAVLVRREHRLLLVAERELDQPVLRGLKAGRASEGIAEARIIARRHGGEHVPRLDQLRLNSADTRQVLERGCEIVRHDQATRRIELVQRQLHPQLGGLVDDDEQHLVVRIGARLLRAEQRVELEIVAVAHCAGEIGVRRGGRLRGVLLAGFVRHEARVNGGTPIHELSDARLGATAPALAEQKRCNLLAAPTTTIPWIRELASQGPDGARNSKGLSRVRASMAHQCYSSVYQKNGAAVGATFCEGSSFPTSQGVSQPAPQRGTS